MLSMCAHACVSVRVNNLAACRKGHLFEKILKTKLKSATLTRYFRAAAAGRSLAPIGRSDGCWAGTPVVLHSTRRVSFV
jgi:hypothetical protein